MKLSNKQKKAEYKERKEKTAIIDGERFPLEMDGMVLVDSYYIPKEQAEEYSKDREYYAQKTKEIFAKFCYEVVRDWKGSQDGEGILGRDRSGELIAVVHLDPDFVEMMKDADRKKNLEGALLDSNDITPELYQRYKEDKEQKENQKNKKK